jgi:hypothetical protein
MAIHKLANGQRIELSEDDLMAIILQNKRLAQRLVCHDRAEIVEQSDERGQPIIVVRRGDLADEQTSGF